MKQREHSNHQNVQLSTCYMNNIVGEKQKAKAKAKRKSYLTQSELETYEIWYCTWTTQSPKACAWRKKNPLSPLLHSFQGKSRKGLPINIMMLVQITLLMDNVQKFIWKTYDEPIWRSSRTQHYDDHNVHRYFKVKASGAQDTWHKTIGHPQTATRSQELYKYKWKTQHYWHHCKSTRKTTRTLLWSFSKKLIITEILRSLLKCKSMLSYLVKDKLLPHSSSLV